MELFPENGGYRLNCGSKSSVYITYGTYNDPVKGSIRSVTINDNRGVYGKTETMYVAWYASKKDDEYKCEKALKLKRKTGEKILDENIFGRLQYKTYKLMMAKPCGELFLTIGPSR